METLLKKGFKILTCFLMMSVFFSCGDKKEPRSKEEVVAPSQIVPVDQAKNMYDNYSKRRVPLIQQYEDSINREQNIGKEFAPSRFVSYDYKTIKQYIAYIEQEAKKANVDISTLRFYFSNYPDKPFFENKDSILHPRQNSIMLSPTVQKGDQDYLFYIGGSQEKQEAILLSDNFEELKGIGSSQEKLKSYASSVPSFTNPSPIIYAGTSVTMNRGGNSPPPQK